MRTETVIRAELAETENTHGTESVETALSLMDLGDFFELADRAHEACACYFRSAKIYKLLGEDHRLLEAVALKSAAEMLKTTGRTGRARVLKRQVRRIMFEYTSFGES